LMLWLAIIVARALSYHNICAQQTRALHSFLVLSPTSAPRRSSTCSVMSRSIQGHHSSGQYCLYNITLSSLQIKPSNKGIQGEMMCAQEDVSLISQVEENRATRFPVLTAHEVTLTVGPRGRYGPTLLMLSLQT